jgi:uncharacterized protein (DUF736 family)
MSRYAIAWVEHERTGDYLVVELPQPDTGVTIVAGPYRTQKQAARAFLTAPPPDRSSHP